MRKWYGYNNNCTTWQLRRNYRRTIGRLIKGECTQTFDNKFSRPVCNERGEYNYRRGIPGYKKPS